MGDRARVSLSSTVEPPCSCFRRFVHPLGYVNRCGRLATYIARSHGCWSRPALPVHRLSWFSYGSLPSVEVWVTALLHDFALREGTRFPHRACRSFHVLSRSISVLRLRCENFLTPLPYRTTLWRLGRACNGLTCDNDHGMILPTRIMRPPICD